MFHIIKRQQNLMNMEMNFIYAWMVLLIWSFQQVNFIIIEVFYHKLDTELPFNLLIYEFFFENICESTYFEINCNYSLISYLKA